MPTVKHNTNKAEALRKTPLKNCDDFNAEMLPWIFIPDADRSPWLQDAPAWSDSDHDVLADPGKDVCQPDRAEWRSAPLRMPNTLKFAVCDENENWTTASIFANISQKVHERDPRINFERQGWDANGDRMTHKDIALTRYTLTIEDAGNLARALLLLIDLALGISDGPVNPPATADRVAESPSDSLTADQIIVEASMRGVKASTVLAEHTASE